MAELNPTAASLLGLLHHGEMSGWDLSQRIEETIGYFWNVTRSQIYRELKTLSQKGLIREIVQESGDRRPYVITPTGQKAFAHWIRNQPGNDLIRFPLLLTMFFGAHLSDDEMRRFLIRFRLRHQQRLHEYETALLRVEEARAPHLYHVITFGIGFARFVIAWIDALPWTRDEPER